MSTTARRYTITGKVQGVGFRPFVYRLAHRCKLKGWVRNCTGQVEIHAEGTGDQLERFSEALVNDAPMIAEPSICACSTTRPERFEQFSILPSEQSGTPRIHIPADFFTCKDCEAELRDPGERRYQYPFINCTQCGPRYTIIEQLPYDRPYTSMAEFPLCDECRKEYEDPFDRRFHAQPLACPVCGPKLRFISSDTSFDDTDQALNACIKVLKAGKIVAVKGIGGYHLMCDAMNTAAIDRLRRRKPRPDKPLALLLPMRGNDDLDSVREIARPTQHEADLLRTPARPIVLVESKPGNLPASIAPGLKEIGVMLPYSPLHHLVLDRFGGSLVATSANISGEPVLTDGVDVETRLAHVSDACLHHNRRIVRPADDPVYRTIGGRPRPLRMGRGNSPVEIDLPFSLDHPVLSTGSHMKNTVALAWDDRLVVSPHIGDLDSLRSQTVFKDVIDDLQQLYQVEATHVCCDAHPSYSSTRWAEGSGMAVTRVFHHHAHASALVLDHWRNEDWLIFTWDGVGYGEDGNLWGGEALHGRPGKWQRVASLLPFNLPGGEKAGREPWRSAAALVWQAGIDWPGLPVDAQLLYQAWQKGINCPRTSAAGRLFDAAAALCGILQVASFEGQGPMMLEQLCNTLQASTALPVHENNEGLLVADWTPLLPEMLDERQPIADRAARFHSRLAHTILKQAQLMHDKTGVINIGLTGGVFQNRTLADYAVELLSAGGFKARLPETLPANDAGICAGQVVEFAMQQETHPNQ